MDRTRSKLFSMSAMVVLVAFGVCRAEDPPTPKEDAPQLTKDDGPFMVLAYNFRGPTAESSAKALVTELRNDHDLPAFTYRNPERPANDQYDVYVGNCKTPKEAFELTKRVKKITSKVLAARDREPAFDVRKRKGLSRALARPNPLVSAEDLFKPAR